MANPIQNGNTASGFRSRAAVGEGVIALAFVITGYRLSVQRGLPDDAAALVK
jgi:hypothetical protein